MKERNMILPTPESDAKYDEAIRTLDEGYATEDALIAEHYTNEDSEIDIAKAQQEDLDSLYEESLFAEEDFE